MSDSKNEQSSFLVRVIGSVFRAMTGAYALSVVGYLVARWLFSDLVIIEFFNSFGHLLLIPALLLLPLALLLRHWLNVALLIPVVSAFAFFYGVFFLPSTSPPPPDDAPRLNLLTYNLLANNRPLDDTLTIIREADADIVLLQEITTVTAPQIRQALADDYAYMALNPVEGFPTHGQGILSRFPITDDAMLQNMRLGMQRTVVAWRGQPLVIYNVHPPHPGLGNGLFDPSVRSSVLKKVLQRSLDEDSRVLIGGDFNMSDLSYDYDLFSQHYADAYRVAGWGMGWTFPADVISPVPVLRLDYLFYDAGWQAIEAVRLQDSGGSDHYPVQVTLADLSRTTFQAP
jgi:endonuclease/exonuclease/phosphatase (EEP) superfamily protein YafD